MLEELDGVLLDEAANAQLTIPRQPRGGESDDIVDSDVPAQEGASAAPAGLSERDRQILAFERQWWRHAGAKEQAIRETFHMGVTRYYQALNALLDAPAALAFDPVLVGRLRRLRQSRSRAR